jgi:2-methylcitrate dehydratase PrpD
MALALRQSMETGGWYPPPILGAFGAVAAAARLLRLSPRQICDAFSLMLCQRNEGGNVFAAAAGCQHHTDAIEDGTPGGGNRGGRQAGVV